MTMMEKSRQAFFELLRAGLWEKEAQFSVFNSVDFREVYRIAEEQSVTGLVAAGIEHLKGVKVPQDVVLKFVGSTLQMEQRNKTMNAFVASLIKRLREKDILALLVKGQGIAQCYERPFWRACGDVDLLLSEENYEKAKVLLVPLALNVDTEYSHFKHLGMIIEGWVVELHGTLHSRLSKRIDRQLDAIQVDTLKKGNMREWNHAEVPIFLPTQNNDVIFIFTHILHHFYIEGIGLRQICDWCRLLWTYRKSLDYGLLESRIRKMGLLTEWQAFAALAVLYLGMPPEAMPLYDRSKKNASKWKRKADKIMAFILETGNFGHNRDLAGGIVNSAWRKMKDFARNALVFPMDSVKFFFHFLFNGIRVAFSSKFRSCQFG